MSNSSRGSTMVELFAFHWTHTDTKYIFKILTHTKTLLTSNIRFSVLQILWNTTVHDNFSRLW